MTYNPGEIYYVDLDPAKGTAQRKKRPCVVVSNAHYNHYFNTIIVVPISSSKKFLEETRFIKSPLFIQLANHQDVQGTILTQHLRSIDPRQRITSAPIAQLTPSELADVQQALLNFF